VCFTDDHKTDDGQSVLIFSTLGISRSVTIAVAYIMWHKKIAFKVCNCHPVNGSNCCVVGSNHCHYCTWLAQTSTWLAQTSTWLAQTSTWLAQTSTWS
jgi:hypothetical protein